MDRKRIGPLYEDLTAEAVQNLIGYGIYEARQANGARDRSRAYNVIHKIYNIETSTEIKYWFQCSWCELIWKTVNKRGTAPLLRHIDSCPQRPSLILPAQVQQVDAPQNQIGEGQHDDDNASLLQDQQAQVQQVDALRSEDICPLSGVPLYVRPVVTPFELAVSLAQATMIGWKYGPLHEDDFLPIVPKPSEFW